VGYILSLESVNGIGPQAVQNGSYAWNLAKQFQKVVTSQLQELGANHIHLFLAVPVALSFFFGQLSRVFGPLTLYEWDFDRRKIPGGGYFPSIKIPIES